MANGVKRFQSHGAQFRPIVREVGEPEVTAATVLSIHARATASRKAPQAPNNRFVTTALAGVRQAAKVALRGGTSNPIRNDKFV